MWLRKHFILKLLFLWRTADVRRYEFTTSPMGVLVMPEPWVMVPRKQFVLKLFFLWRTAEVRRYEFTINPLVVPVMAESWVMVPRKQYILKWFFSWRTVEGITMKSVIQSRVSRGEAVSEVFFMQERMTRVFRAETVPKWFY